MAEQTVRMLLKIIDEQKEEIEKLKLELVEEE